MLNMYYVTTVSDCMFRIYTPLCQIQDKKTQHLRLYILTPMWNIPNYVPFQNILAGYLTMLQHF